MPLPEAAQAQIIRQLALFADGEEGRSAAIETRSGFFHQVNGEVPRPAGDLAGLVLAMALYDSAAPVLGQELALDSLPRSEGGSLLEVFDEGRRLSLRELIGLYLASGDLRIASELFALIGADQLRGKLEDLDCYETRILVAPSDQEAAEQNQTCCIDCLLALEGLEESRYLPLREAMANAVRASSIARAVGKGASAASLASSSSEGIVEVGLVMGWDPFRIAFLAESPRDRIQTSAEIESCVRKIYEVLAGS